MTDEVEIKGRYKLTRAWVKQELIRELAVGKISQTDLAARYGVGPSAVAEFKRRHAVDVERARDSLNDEWVGLWVADKRNRLAGLQAQIENLEDMPTSARTAEVYAKLLRDVAEELGDITNKNKVEVDVVRYEINGVSLENLK